MSPYYCSSPRFSYHFILRSRTLQILTYTLKLKTHTIVNFNRASLWNTEALISVHGHLRNTQILYTHISSSSKSPTSHCQMLFFTAALRDEWRRIFHEWATFYRVKEKNKAPTLLLLFNQQDFWMQMSESPLPWLAAWVSLSHRQQAQWTWLVFSWVQGKIKDWYCYQWIMRFVFISKNKIITEPSHRLLYVCSIYFSV